LVVQERVIFLNKLTQLFSVWLNYDHFPLFDI
jgi:hypothetical protein